MRDERACAVPVSRLYGFLLILSLCSVALVARAVNLQVIDTEYLQEEGNERFLRDNFPDADIRIEVTNTYPPLGTAPDAQVVEFVKSLTGSNSTTKVAFGTEGGLFSSVLDIPTVVCGPGSMAQGHKPDEFIGLDQLAKCDAMLDALLVRLIAGV